METPQQKTNEHVPLREYALIGDCHGSALISRNGSIDWCCLTRFDEDPHFFRLLDQNIGGFFDIQFEENFEAKRTYLPRTNLLRSQFNFADSTLEITDFMPVARSSEAGTYDYVHLSAPHWLVRRIQAVRGRTQFMVRYRPSWQFGQASFPLAKRSQFISAPNGPYLYSSRMKYFEIDNNMARACITLEEGEEARFVLAAAPALDRDPISEVPQRQSTAEAYWNEWSNFCRYVGPYKEQVLRSALVLKLLTYAPTGAIIAAPTTSLPERIGGSRNFDYRYCWIRDASFTLYALSSLGYSGEATRFADYIRGCCNLTYPDVQVVYGIAGETDLVEREIPGLRGYKDSAPVRTGNAAFKQEQLDIYGELQESFDLFRTLGGKLDDAETRLVKAMADAAIKNWENKDYGIWEMRSQPLNHVYSKMLCWVAVDRAGRILSSGHQAYKNAAQDILDGINSKGINREDGTLRQAFENTEADASLLRAPLLGVPLDDFCLRSTIEKIERELGERGLLHRYHGEDGFEGKEGAFLICCFWLASALLHLGEYERAVEKFEWFLTLANDLGLYSEEIDIENFDFLGNFPQALTHLALIECAVNIEIYKKDGIQGIAGTLSDRAQHYVGAAVGLKGIWAAYSQSGRIGRIFSSSDSKFQ